MRTLASLRGHPIHPMLVPLPIGLWIFSFVCDLAGMRSLHPDLWYVLALYTMIGGVAGALVAAVPGLVDFIGLERGRHRRIAAIHMALNVTIILIYVGDVGLRLASPTDTMPPLLVSLVAVLLLAVSGWLGGALVHVHGVGVEPAARGEATAQSAPSERE